MDAQTLDSELARDCLAAAAAEPDGETAAAVEVLLRAAWAQGASDVHVTPEAERFRIRFRLDGVLREVGSLPRARLPLLVQRIKVLAQLLTYRCDVAQDGRIAAELGGGPGEIRVSILPTLHGEKAVLRLLLGAGPPSLEGLGWPADAARELEGVVAAPAGLALFAGPAGSGKTSAIYAALSAIAARGERACASLEEPIEAELSGVDQTPIDRCAGLDFAGGLRAVLRQDPEVVFVGEARDGETARIAVQAGLTGHLVLTTVHAREACSASLRLLDLGVDPASLAACLDAVFALRLARRLCAACAGAGGSCCHGSGFRGRTPLVEALPLDDGVRAALSAGGGLAALRAAATAAGYTTLAQRAAAAVAAGLTSPREVERVLGRGARREEAHAVSR